MKRKQLTVRQGTLWLPRTCYRQLASYRKHIAKTDQVEELIEYAASPIPIEVMPFGKHKGMRMDEIPVSYFNWALQNMTELDSDLRIAMEEQAASRADA
ncbi:putative quorum-sensing-regulated virulence factor [Alicyclobacillus dauci]|uniref:DUF3820 family protein n=1 Tax=Alicyclobacillus dauci TaxID=1475485 RepID=A0ABY6YZA9_9BACL|nr:DUF3820 family protein [Alicyclobacillus dauci]WAH35970.1 DUF3820 family protein [Alicyclobacillus dauci]